MDPRREYIARLNRVLEYIEHHLSEPLDLATLAGVAHFSDWHFHRLFSALTGETVADHVRRRRLEVAANRLWANRSRTVLAIALETGFASAEVFSRNFRQHFGQSPTQWRRGGHLVWAATRREQMSKIHQADRKNRQAVMAAFNHHPEFWPPGRISENVMHHAMPVNLQTLPDTTVAYMRHVGPYGTSGIPALWQRFALWCGQQGWMQPRRKMFGISQDNPEVTAPERCRYDACIIADPAFVPHGDVGVQTIPGGRYACAEFKGSTNDISAAWQWLCGEWIAASGYQFDDRPVFELYAEDYVQEPESGRFHCLLCIPVKPL